MIPAPRTTASSGLLTKANMGTPNGRKMLALSWATMTICMLVLVSLINLLITSRMFADLDHSHPEVRKDIFDWGTWIISTLGLGGMRLDAIKHYSLSFLADLISHLDLQHKDLFFVGEYWEADSKALQKVLRAFNGRIKLFDVQLVYSLSDYSKGLKTDLRNVFEGSLSELDPHHAVVSVLSWPSRLPALLIFSDLCCKS